MKFDETDFLRARPFIALFIALSISFKVVSRREMPCTPQTVTDSEYKYKVILY